MITPKDVLYFFEGAKLFFSSSSTKYEHLFRVLRKKEEIEDLDYRPNSYLLLLLIVLELDLLL